MKYNRFMENETSITTLTPDSAAAAAAGSPPSTAFEAPLPGAVAAAVATPPANQLRPRTRRERLSAEFCQRHFRCAATPEEKAEDEVVDEDAVRLDYEFVLRGGREEVLRVKSQLVLPMALALENLPQTDVSFPEMIDRVLVQPLNTKFRAFLQRLFDAASRAAIEKEAAEKETPPPANMEFKRPKPINGASFSMPEIDAKLPLPQRPGSRVWAAGTNGM